MDYLDLNGTFNIVFSSMSTKFCLQILTLNLLSFAIWNHRKNSLSRSHPMRQKKDVILEENLRKIHGTITFASMWQTLKVRQPLDKDLLRG